MKRIFLLMISFCAVQITFAQSPASRSSESLNVDRTQNMKRLDQSVIENIRAQSADFRSPSYYWVNFSDAVDYVLTGDEDYANFSYMILWPDSTVKIVDPLEGDFFWRLHGYASDFDPVSSYLAEYVNGHETLIGDAEDWFTDDHGFDIDSLRFYFFYDRYNTDYVDTLKVYVMGPGSNVFNDGGGLGGIYYDQDGNGDFDEGTDIAVVFNRYNAAQNRPNGTYTEYDILLDDDDTASFNATYRQLSVDLHIDDNGDRLDHTVGVAFQYRPGQPYSFGDTLGDLSDPPVDVYNPLNRVTLICYEEQEASAPVSWAEYSNNQDAIATWEVRYSLGSGYDGNYIPTVAYTDEFTLEHAYVDWKVAPKGAFFIASKPSPCVDLTLDFTDLSNFIVDAGDANWFWDFGDGNVDFGQDVSHTYDAPGTYTTTLIVTEGTTSYQFEKAAIVDYCVSVSDIDDLTNFKMYPVPASNTMNLEVAFSKPEDITITISDIQGQTMYQSSESNVSVFNKPIDVSKFAEGTYTLEIHSNEQVTTRNFIISR